MVSRKSGTKTGIGSKMKVLHLISKGVQKHDEIGKQLSVSKQFVNYQIHFLINNGIIKDLTPNTNKYKKYELTEGMTLAKADMIVKKLRKNYTRRVKSLLIETRKLNKNNNTAYEKKIEKILIDNGINFIKQFTILGKPDFFIKPNICIFIDGCYFHGCTICYSNVLNKRIGKTMLLDRENNRILRDLGLSVIRIKTHLIKNKKHMETLKPILTCTITFLTQSDNTALVEIL